MTNDPILRYIHACVIAGVPPFLEGVPGTGKTARVRHYGRVTETHVERWLLSRCEPIDIKPRAYHDGKVILGEAPEMDRLVEMAHKRLSKLGGVGIWALCFMDELNLATRETEGAALDKIDAPPEGIAVIAAGNPPTRGQAARSLGAAAANRFCHIDVPADPKAWANAQVSGWPEGADDFPLPDPAKLADATGKARMLGSAFILRRPSLLEACPDTIVEAGKAWPSTRSWEMALKLYAVCIALGLSAEDRMALIGGCIGKGAMIEFEAYCLDASLIDPEAWLARPKAFAPDRIDQAVAAASAVAHAVKTQLDEPRWRAAWKIVAHLAESTTTDGQSLLDASMVMADLLLNIYENLGDKTASVPNPALSGLYPTRMAKVLV